MKQFSSEHQFQKAVCKLFVDHGWRAYRHPDSRKANVSSTPGFPDLVFAKPGLLVFAECKMPGKRPSDEQIIWLTNLASSASYSSLVFLWCPEGWPEIEKVAKRGK